VRARANDTAGLNSPPETRKKIHTLIVRASPKATAINIKFDESTKAVSLEKGIVAFGRLAMFVAPKAMKRNIVVPTYSPTYA
jgi:hypothetical protein